MKRNILFLFCLGGFLAGVYAQNFSKEFGKVTADEYKMTEYRSDPDAEAIVLFDIGHSHFDKRPREGFEINYERRTRIKIFSEAGLKWAEIEIPFYRKDNIYETIYDLSAVSYLYENGKITATPLNLENTYTEKISDSWYVKKFAVPNIKPGAIFEYSYKINSQHIFSLRDWYFQWKIPVVYSEYNTAMVPFFEYQYLLQGTKEEEIEITTEKNTMNEKFFANTKYFDLKYKFVRRNIPAFKSEDFISSLDDYIAKITFQLGKINYPDGRSEQIMSTWDKLIQELLTEDNFGKFIKKATKNADKIIDTGKLKELPESEKFNSVLNFVKENYVWNQNNGIYATKSSEKLIEEKNGNAADINLLTVGLLNAVGIDSSPMLLSTRPNGKIKTDYPFLNFFNYVVICSTVNGKKIMSDATEPLIMNNRIPEKCINDVGLIVDKDKPAWVNTRPTFPSSSTTSLVMNPETPDKVSVKMVKVLHEYEALKFKKIFADKKEGLKEFFERENLRIIDSTLQIKEPLLPARMQFYNYQCLYKPDFINGKMYLSPFLYEVPASNPLKEKERSYPVDFIFSKGEQLECRITVPPGYSVDFIPQDTTVDNELYRLKYTAQLLNGTVLVFLDYLLKKAVYAPEEYTEIKSFFDELIKKSNEKIVLTPSFPKDGEA